MSQRGGTVLGILIGVALGALVAFALAWYVTRHSPFREAPLPAAKPTLGEAVSGIAEMLRQAPQRAEPSPAAPVGSAPKVGEAPSASVTAVPPASESQRRTAPPAKTLDELIAQVSPAAGAGQNGARSGSAPAAAATPATPAMAPSPAASAAPAGAVERWFWQVGAYGSEQEANRVRAELALQGLTSTVEPARMGDGRMLYRVRVGPYGSQPEANAARGRLQAAGFQPVLVKG